MCASCSSERLHPHPSRSTQLRRNCFLSSPSIQEAPIPSSPARRGCGSVLCDQTTCVRALGLGRQGQESEAGI